MKDPIGKPYEEIVDIKQWVNPAKDSIIKWRKIVSPDSYNSITTDFCGLCKQASKNIMGTHPCFCQKGGCPLFHGDLEPIDLNCCFKRGEFENIYKLHYALKNAPGKKSIETELVKLCQIYGERLIAYLEGLIAFAGEGK